MGGDARKQIPWRPLKPEPSMALPVMVKREIIALALIADIADISRFAKNA
jgi:hypothetical protein